MKNNVQYARKGNNSDQKITQRFLSGLFLKGLGHMQQTIKLCLNEGERNLGSSET